jgi:hypothetical protein
MLTENAAGSQMWLPVVAVINASIGFNQYIC